MRVNKVICPKCQTSLTSKAGVEVGTAIACPKCKNKFAVAAPDDEIVDDDFEVVDDDEEAAPPKKPVKPVAKKRPAVDDEEEKPRPKKRHVADDEDEEERPKSRRRPVAEDDEESSEDDDRPKAKKRARDDDEDDDRPRKKKKKRRRDEEMSAYGKIKNNIWIRASVLGVLLIILGFVIYLKLIKKSDEKTVTVVTETTEDEVGLPIRNPKVVPPKVEPNQPKKTPTKNDDKKTSIVISGQSATDLAKLQGEWKLNFVTFNGAASATDPTDPKGRWFKGLQAGATDTKGVAQLTIDASKSPAEIDFVISTNVTIRAIYRFEDENTLEICSMTINGPRPQEFSAPQGSKCTLEVLKRKP